MAANMMKPKEYVYVWKNCSEQPLYIEPMSQFECVVTISPDICTLTQGNNMYDVAELGLACCCIASPQSCLNVIENQQCRY